MFIIRLVNQRLHRVWLNLSDDMPAAIRHVESVCRGGRDYEAQVFGPIQQLADRREYRWHPPGSGLGYDWLPLGQYEGDMGPVILAEWQGGGWTLLPEPEATPTEPPQEAWDTVERSINQVTRDEARRLFDRASNTNRTINFEWITEDDRHGGGEDG